MTETDHSVVGWRAWYVDGQVFSSAQTEWCDLPEDGVAIVLLYYRDGGRRIMQATWYFRWEGPQGIVYGQEEIAPPDPAYYAGACVIRGRWTSDENFKAIEDAAMASTWP